LIGDGIEKIQSVAFECFRDATSFGSFRGYFLYSFCFLFGFWTQQKVKLDIRMFLDMVDLN
jgi:hypothetical protein